MKSQFQRIYKYLTTSPQYIEQIFNKIHEKKLMYDLKDSKVIQGRLLSEFNKQRKISALSDCEFQVFSQWGDDGIIQYILSQLDIPFKIFVEFGVENYVESNTRFLLVNNNWAGLVMDGSKANIEYIKDDPISWAHDIHAWNTFITKENINSLLDKFIGLGYDKEIGLLSIDVDGNDYWIWREINTVNPIIVVSEFNSIFGKDKPWTIEYKADFVRPGTNKTPLHAFYGSSLLALCDLADEKGYFFVGCNSAGNNAYFIRKDKIGNFKPISAAEGFVLSKFRECFNAAGERTTSDKLRNELKGQKVFNTRTKTLDDFE